MRAMPCNVKITVKCVVKIVVSYMHLILKCVTRYEMQAKHFLTMRAKPWNAKNVVKCVLKANICYTRQASSKQEYYELHGISQYLLSAPSLRLQFLLFCSSSSAPCLRTYS